MVCGEGGQSLTDGGHFFYLRDDPFEIILHDVYGEVACDHVVSFDVPSPFDRVCRGALLISFRGDLRICRWDEFWPPSLLVAYRFVSHEACGEVSPHGVAHRGIF